ncbi:MAG TPA: N-acetyl-gamma-glutamyl-phosphate reductase [Longimicrobiales bacterium]|nr:N-acetyl-gamma-glutamyl-phosphate reductase [Longimicrobiales bacterium]
MHTHSVARAAVFGATGYTGRELVALAERHPRVSIAHVTSESSAGMTEPVTGLEYERAADVDAAGIDVAFMCLPHGESGDVAVRVHDAGVKVVDLSADLRDGRTGAVYGLPELWREEVQTATLVANPGCYPTGVLLALAPLLRAGLVDDRRAVVIDAASGVTGAGRTAKAELLFAEVAEDFRAYAVGNTHRHVAEIARGLASVHGDDDVEFVFTPHLLPVRRGILETMYVPLRSRFGAADVQAAWLRAYEREPFVEVRASGLPSLRDAVNRNAVVLGAAAVERVTAPLVTVVAAFDNLVKGAAGQALQNMNLMLGLDETEGLPR